MTSFDPPTDLDHLSDPVDWDYDEWDTPLPDGVYHSMLTNDAGHLVCCGRRPLALPCGDWQTADPDRVTCGGITDAS